MRFGLQHLPSWGPPLAHSICRSIRLQAHNPPPFLPHILHKEPLFDQMIANIYQPNQGIYAHIDLLRFDDGITILSLESDCIMHFTSHQDGKIRVWKVSSKNPSKHKRIGSFPTFKDYKCSMNPKNYMEVRRNRNAVMVGEMKVVVGVNQRGLEMGL
ncbi:hypothetical protein LR48_Vigan02g091900 [Vigna angularis]|uniref:Uncharacterized protein n=1 Tax=Phaseolus angularis TaxID=3914 RepID=A0A0L9TX59_PHAAN|nr:hypothetical protein LR48_Vigan02g091900 [Vigna angularis]